MRHQETQQFVSNTTIGARFGRWVVLAATKRVAKNHERYWLCRCDCGTEREITLGNVKAHVKRGGDVGCGCFKQEWVIGHTLPNSQALKNRLLKAYKASAKKRNLDWEIEDNFFFKLITEDCHYCGIVPATLKQRNGQTLMYNGIDRKDNIVGYTAANIVSCCKTCNYLKKAVPYEEFVVYLNRVAAFRASLELKDRVKSWGSK